MSGGVYCSVLGLWKWISRFIGIKKNSKIKIDTARALPFLKIKRPEPSYLFYLALLKLVGRYSFTILFGIVTPFFPRCSQCTDIHVQVWYTQLENVEMRFLSVKETTVLWSLVLKSRSFTKYFTQFHTIGFSLI